MQTKEQQNTEKTEIEELKTHLKEYLAFKGYKFNHEKKISCVNPAHHEDTPSMGYKDNHLKCFGCGSYYSIIDLVILDYCLTNEERKQAEDSNCTDKFLKDRTKQSQAIKLIKGWLSSGQFNNVTPLDIEEAPRTYQRDYKRYEEYLKTQDTNQQEQSLKEYLEEKRGISKNIYAFPMFKIFYDIKKQAVIFFKNNWRVEQERDSNPKAINLIVGYNQRGTNKDDPNPKKAIVDYQTIYDNLNVLGSQQVNYPIVIVEGETDLLSIYEATKENDKINLSTVSCIALSSVNNNKALINAIKIMGVTNQVKLILSLDNDKAGEHGNKELAELCKSNGIKYTTKRIVDKNFKDANEQLLKEPNKLRNNILEVASNIDYYIEHEQETQEEQSNEEELENQRINQEKENKARNDFLLSYQAFNMLDGFKKEIEESKKRKTIKTRFDKLDDALEGGLSSSLIVIGAISSLGKTTLALQIADQIAQTNESDVIIFSLEMGRNELIAKSVSRLTYLRCSDDSQAKTSMGILQGKRYKRYDSKTLNLISDCINDYKSYAKNIYIVEGVGDFGTKKIRETIEEHIKATGKHPIVLVDYLQLLTAPNEHLTDKQAIDKNIMELKRISRDYKIPLIAISSLNRDSYSGKVDLSSFKESGAIEYSSDILIGLNMTNADYAKGKNDLIKAKESIREEKSKEIRDITLEILKNRNGKTGATINFKYNCLFNCFIQEEQNKADYLQLLEYARKSQEDKDKLTYEKFVDDNLPF